MRRYFWARYAIEAEGNRKLKGGGSGNPRVVSPSEEDVQDFRPNPLSPTPLPIHRPWGLRKFRVLLFIKAMGLSEHFPLHISAGTT